MGYDGRPMRSQSTRHLHQNPTLALLVVVVGACSPTEEMPPTDIGNITFDIVVPDLGVGVDVGRDISVDGTDTGSTDAGLTDAPITDAACPSAWARCADLRCYSLQDDPAHCGGCTVACAAGARCNAGSCEASDGGAPTDIAADAGLRTDVPQATDVGATDVGTTDSGPPRCPGAQVICSGSCRDLSADLDNCGTCSNRCMGGTTCMGGTCRAIVVPDSGGACMAGTTDCSGYCATTSNDPFHCGGCNRRCMTGEQCVASVCQIPTGVMDAGTVMCAAGATSCSGFCAMTATDPFHCGACNRRCATGEVCRSGACAPGGMMGCAAGQTMCGTTCRDLTIDYENCGA